MRAPFTQLYLHLVWSTWDRLPLISPSLEARLYAALTAKCKELQCEALAIGGVPDHIHMLVRFAPTILIADLVKGNKGSSSHLVTHQWMAGEFFKWQGAYRAFTVSPGDVERVRQYIHNQKVHHRVKTEITDWELPMEDFEADHSG